jgi:hypothetical protein
MRWVTRPLVTRGELTFIAVAAMAGLIAGSLRLIV